MKEAAEMRSEAVQMIVVLEKFFGSPIWAEVYAKNNPHQIISFSL